MPMVGNIKLPITGPIKAAGSDMEMIDILFDLKVDFDKALPQLNNPAVFAVRSAAHNLILVLLYMPPLHWADFEGQKYQVFLSPTLPWMIHYFQDKRVKATEKFDYDSLTTIVEFLNNFLPKQITIHTTIK